VSEGAVRCITVWFHLSESYPRGLEAAL